MRFGDLVDGQHVMLTRKQWENSGRKKKGGGESSGVKGSSDRGSGHEKSEDKPSGTKPEQKSKKKFKCYNCREKGHFSKECPTPKKKKQDKAMLVKKQEEEPALLLSEAYIRECRTEVVHGKMFLNEQKVKPKLGDDVRYDTKIWYLDIRASNHMLGARELFTELNKSITGSVKFGDGSLVEIVGRGTVLSTARDGSHRGLTDVYFIPKLRSNIVSLSQLKEHSCRISLENGYLQIFDQQQKLLMKAPRGRNRLYTLNMHIG